MPIWLATAALAATLEAPPLARGCPVPLTVAGLGVGERAHVVLGTPGRTCPAPLGGACVDLVPARYLGAATAGPDGRATLVLDVPDRSATALLQAVAIRGVDGAESVVTPLVEAPLVACVPGCTDPASPDFDPDATWDDGSCAPPWVVVAGEVTIHSSLDLWALEGVNEITGDLVLVGTGMDAVVLPDALQVVGGTLKDASTTVTSLVAPGLRTVGALDIDGTALSTLELPALATCGGIHLTAPVTTLDLTALERADVLWLYPDGTHPDVRLDALVAADELNGRLGSLEAPRLLALLEDDDHDRSMNLDNTGDILLPALASVTRDIQISSDAGRMLLGLSGALELQLSAWGSGTLELPHVTHVDVLRTGLGATTVSTPALATCDSLHILHADGDVAFPALTEVGILVLDEVGGAASFPVLARVDDLELTEDGLPFTWGTLDFPVLTDVGDLDIDDTNVEGLAFLDAVVTAEQVTITDNLCISQVAAEDWAARRAEPDAIVVTGNLGPC